MTWDPSDPRPEASATIITGSMTVEAPDAALSGGLAGSLRASQDRAVRRRESLREQQAIAQWLRHLATGRATPR
jgi:hypothetical protein